MQMDIYIVFTIKHLHASLVNNQFSFFSFFSIVVSNVSLTNISIFFSENDHTQMAL